MTPFNQMKLFNSTRNERMRQADANEGAYSGCASAQDERRLILMRTSFAIFHILYSIIFLDYCTSRASVIWWNVIRARQLSNIQQRWKFFRIPEAETNDSNRHHFYHSQIYSYLFISLVFRVRKNISAWRELVAAISHRSAHIRELAHDENGFSESRPIRSYRAVPIGSSISVRFQFSLTQFAMPANENQVMKFPRNAMHFTE